MLAWEGHRYQYNFFSKKAFNYFNWQIKKNNNNFASNIFISSFSLTVDCNCFQKSQQFSDMEKQAKFCYLKYACRGPSPSYTVAHLVMGFIYLFCKFPTFHLETNIKLTARHIKVKHCRLFSFRMQSRTVAASSLDRASLRDRHEHLRERPRKQLREGE